MSEPRSVLTTHSGASLVLIAVIAYELYGSVTLAAVAGRLLAVTAAFFIRSRAALAVIMPVPFQLIWLLFLVRYSRDGRLRQMIPSTAALGVGLYSYMSMLFFAPLHLLFSLAEIARQRHWRHAIIVLAVFAVLMAPLAAWQLTHPGRAHEIVASYRVYPSELTPLQGLKDILSWSSLANRSDIYWNAFNPSRLFFSGESSLVDSTRTAGIYPLAYLVLLPIGVYALLRRPLNAPRLSLLVIFLVAPVPGVLVGADTIGRYLVAGPIAALLATAAIDWLWRSGSIVVRAMVVAALVASVALFAGFVTYYKSDWRADAAKYLDGNLKGALDVVLTTPRESAPGVVYLSENIPYANVLWEFYRRAHDRGDLAGRDRGLRLADPYWRDTPGRAMAIVPGGDDSSVATLTGAGWRVMSQVGEFYGGPPTFYVLARP